MADYKPEGEGAHPTLAGNTLDPNVNADGAVGGSQGVGGTSESRIKEEGLEHIKAHSDAGGAPLGESSTGEPSTGNTSSAPPITAPQPPASNPGADDPSAGIAGGSGGTSSAANAHSPVSGTDQQNTGILGTVKNYLGYGGTSGQPREASEGVGAGQDTSETGGALSSGVGETSATTGASGIGERQETSTPGNTFDSGRDTSATSGVGGQETSAPGNTFDSGRDTSATTGAGDVENTSATSNAFDSGRDTGVGAVAAASTGSEPTESADPTTKDTAQPEGEQAGSADDSGKGYNPDKGLDDAHTGHLRENKSAIPSAGGEQLGEKHWGESKIVPDNPKKEEEAGVASAEGQPTDQVRDNTNANTGGAPPPGQSSSSTGAESEEKEKLVDKIKNKLHIGHKS